MEPDLRIFWRAVLLIFLIPGVWVSGLSAQGITPPPPPEIPPLIGTSYSSDSNGDRIDDALTEKSAIMAEQIQNAFTADQQQVLRAQFDEQVIIEMIFDRPITQRQIDDFLNLGGEIKYVYKAVSYGWNGRIQLSRIASIPPRMGDSLVLVEESKPVELCMRIASQTGRVRPVWANGFAGSAGISSVVYVLNRIIRICRIQLRAWCVAGAWGVAMIFGS